MTRKRKSIRKKDWKTYENMICSAVMGKLYSLKHIMKMLGVSRRTLFNWEKAGKIPKAKRDPMNNYRYYTETDLQKLKKITGRPM
jgi:hypothetical protein